LARAEKREPFLCFDFNFKKSSMKNTNIIYWVVTVIFALFMLSSAIPDILLVPDAKAFIGRLGYPDYFIRFIGVAKALGAIAIVVPANFPKLKEWAYAGLFYDLFAATVSQLAVDGFKPGIFFMALPISFCLVSHALYHKRIATTKA
jgi:hypothetical protein